jgi:hypothetical protein
LLELHASAPFDDSAVRHENHRRRSDRAIRS